MRFSKSAPILLIGALFLLCAWVWSAGPAPRPLPAAATLGFSQREPQLTLAVLDVGQGDAVFIESPTGVQVLIDGGPDSSVLRELPAVMPAFDRSLDAVIATHPDQDHIGGLVEVLRRYQVGAFIEPGLARDTAAYRALMQAVRDGGVEHQVARRGMTLDLGGGAYLAVLYPDRDVSSLEANDASIVARLVFASSSALLMGDAPKLVEYAIATNEGAALKSDVLKVGHHGSRTSTGDTLLQQVRPNIALISAGKDNRYGHPHAEVLEALSRFDVNVLQTAELGRIVCTSDAARFSCR